MSFYTIAPFIKVYYPQYYSLESYPAGECAPFHKTGQEWGIFSNFAKTPMEVSGVVFDSAEKLFQTMKFQDEETVRAVFSASNPKFTAKKFEKTRRRTDWGREQREIHRGGSKLFSEENGRHMGSQTCRRLLFRAQSTGAAPYGIKGRRPTGL